MISGDNHSVPRQDKLRGGYYTPPAVTTWLCRWAVRSANDVILEPGCGDGAFLKAAACRLLDLGAGNTKTAQNLTGVELVSAEAKKATDSLCKLLGNSARKTIKNSDFFAWWTNSDQPGFNVVIGNPPFIRYQLFPESHRTIAMEIMKTQGLKPNRLTNIWVPFVVAATAGLKPGGRLALVLPAEILQVSYAAQLRYWLTERFERIDVIACNELFFKNAQQEVVLLLADGAHSIPSEKKSCHVSLTATATVADITNTKPCLLLERAEPKNVDHSEKWLKYFLDNRQITFMRALRDSEITVPMSTHADIDVGIVTGRNEFFVVSNSQIEEYDLHDYVQPVISRSARLKGSMFTENDWQSLANANARVYLLNIPKAQLDKPDAGLLRYIENGEKQGFHKGYKCSLRKPWYQMPSVWIPDGFVFRSLYDFPRMVLNSSQAISTDTIHRMRSHGADSELIIANSYSWLTAASAEIEGRSYGGGVLELAPTESEKLLMPAGLENAMPLAETDRLIRAGRLDDVLEENARLVLRNHIGLTIAECTLLKSVWMKMRNRRNSRQKQKHTA